MAAKEQFFSELYYASSDSEKNGKTTSKVKVQRRKRKSLLNIRPLETDNQAGDKQYPDTSGLHQPLSQNKQVPNINAVVDVDLTLEEDHTSLLSDPQPGGSRVDRLRPLQVTAQAKMPKRKLSAVKEIPTGLQVFRGQKFYFLPDNDIAQGRRLRIESACKYGAKWIKTWGPGITHIVVDRGITYQDILSYLKIPTIPSKMVLVNELYPPHCITYNHLVNPNQPQYLVEGQQAALAAAAKAIEAARKEISEGFAPEETSTEAASSAPSSSLQVKEDKRHPEKTPSRQGDSLESAASREARLKAEENGTLASFYPKHKTDALDEAISEAKDLQGLPLDASESEQDEDDGNVGSDDEDSAKKPKRQRTTRHSSDWQRTFSCMAKHDGTGKKENPNADTIDILQKMYEYYERTQDHWRSLAYRKAISALKGRNEKISTKEQALAIPFLGTRLAEKIEEIVWTGRLRRLENTILDPNDEALQTFLKIYGVGYKQASAFVAKGLRTLEDLKTNATLSRNQMIGIKHYDDFQTRIPRDEIGRHAKLVRDVLAKINPDIEVQVGGSYRRGASISGDIDYIVTARETSMNTLRAQVLNEMIPRLWAVRYLKCCLAETSSVNGTKWHGAAVLPGSSPAIWRRIDFLLVPPDEYGAALIYFTGNDIFNRSIRLLASKKGMRLNQRGLWKDVIRGPQRSRINQGTLIESRSEAAIFAALGVPWRPPHHRNC